MFCEKNRIYGTTKKLDIDTLKKLFNDKRLSFVKVALLFGSRADGRENLKSDYDFALLMDKEADDGWGVKAKAYDLIGQIFDLDECDFDIVDLSCANSGIIESIKNSFIILKGSEDEVSRIFAKYNKNSK
ncbi:nucleotidyltransferase domain-containing protein [Hydrogenimonas thermophila]|uniref:nucleotidyltransferase domain-containing protein n=1 Tax=Hydrogenimonas thermophila TaxID=223786 RepID=UPI0029373354|nr:nucleotidyltransferase domain-containing protein [Hydrogenimonas thermophila]WOE70322.1 nucleotidyltransferase domain-containing protein [Hydrogenimonas thermophila]WOE72839.1 nucleotidyltransferase domain-containing protein [Hydrogenimonas thermophila]